MLSEYGIQSDAELDESVCNFTFFNYILVLRIILPSDSIIYDLGPTCLITSPIHQVFSPSFTGYILTVSPASNALYSVACLLW